MSRINIDNSTENSHRNLTICLCALLLCSVLGCQPDKKAQKEKFLKDMVAAFGSQKSDLVELSKGVYEDIRVYRDGKQDVIVFERKLSKEIEIDDPELKSILIEEIKKNKSSRKTLELGIEIKIVDKSPDGQVVREFSVKRDDL